MKSISFTLFLMILCHFTSKSQDLLILNSGDEIKAKVVEVGTDEIKYKKWDNLDGPTYTIPKANVVVINYSNGSKDIITPAKVSDKPVTDYTTGKTNSTFASKGCIELGGSFAYSSASVNGTSSSLLILAPAIGWFPVNGFELGAYPLSISTDLNGETTLMPLFAPAYNFNTNSVAYPFVEANIGYISSSLTGSQTLSSIVYGGKLGVKIAINRAAILHLSFQYLHWSYSQTINNYNPYYPQYSYSSTITESVNQILLDVGFTVSL